MPRSIRVVLALVVVVAVVQAVSLVRRGSRGDTDVGVFYRTCVLLSSGLGGALYTRHDVVTDWPISLSPAGLALFQPLASFGPLGASSGWAIANLAFLGVSIVALRRLLPTVGSPRPDILFPWAVIVFVVLSAGSIQVGQFSVLFVACWVLSLTAFLAGSYFNSGMLLAIPTTIKLYPVLMLAASISLIKTSRAGFRNVLGFLLGLFIFSALIPAIAYGSRAVDLNVSFWENVILSPTGQVSYMQTVRAANQSLDALLLRYLTFDAEFHPQEPAMPHLELPKREALRYANLVRLIMFAITVVTVSQWRRRHRTFRAHDVLTMFALWSCTLYLMLPETKARYAVYTFIGFLPLLEVAVTETERSTARAWAIAQVVLCMILIGGLVPEPVKVYGVGFIGAFALWLRNLELIRSSIGASEVSRSGEVTA